MTTPTAALELADLQTKVAHMIARAGEQGTMYVGEPEFAKHQGRMEMGREISELIAGCIAVLTAADEGAPPEEPS